MSRRDDDNERHRRVLLVIAALASLALILAARAHTDTHARGAVGDLAVTGSATFTVPLHGEPVRRRAHRRTVGHGQIRFDGAGPERWAQRWRHARAQLDHTRAQLRRQRRVLLSDPNVVEAINLACATYGHCQTLWRKARCETGGTFDPHATNPSGADGLFQFIDSTWRSTPYARFSVWSPYASALAAGWMHQQGRGKEWSCR